MEIEEIVAKVLEQHKRGIVTTKEATTKLILEVGQWVGQWMIGVPEDKAEGD